jgi:cell division protein FtsA
LDSYKTIIEIGSFSIKTIIYSEFNQEYSIIGTGKTRSRGYTGEEIENFDDFIDSIKNSIVQAEKQANYIIRDTYILITNQSVQIKKTQKDLNLHGAIVEKNDLRKISKIKIPKYENYHYNLYTSHYKIDDKLITDNPIGLNCNKLSIISLVSMIDIKQINLLKNIFQKLQIKILNYLDSTTSYYFYLKNKQNTKTNVVLIDYGFNNINIIMIKNKVLHFIKKIPHGSKRISNDLVNIHNISFDFAEKLKISTIDLSDTRNSIVEIPIWEEFGDNKKKNVGHDNLKEIISDRLDETFELVLNSLPKDKSFYSYVFTGGGSKLKNFYNYFRTKFGYDIQFLEPPKSCGIPKVLNDASIMSLYSSFWLLTNKSSKNNNFVQKIDSLSNKIWYKRFVDLL